MNNLIIIAGIALLCLLHSRSDAYEREGVFIIVLTIGAVGWFLLNFTSN